MKRIISIAAFLCFLAGGTAWGKSLFVMGWDGAGLRNVNLLLQQGKLPNLQSFLASGGHLAPLELIAKTNTQASWVHVFTGLTYDQTGVLGNSNLDEKYEGQFPREYKETHHVFPGMDFWIRPVPFEHTIVSNLKTLGLRIGWFTGKSLVALEEIRSNANAQHDMSPKSKEHEDYIDILGKQVVDFVKQDGPFFIFFLANPDYYGHIDGENSERYLEEFVRCDKWLGKILKSIDRKEVKVMIIADHGFDEGLKTHYNAPDAWLATNLPVHRAYWLKEDRQRAFGTMRDVAFTILDWYRVDYINRIPQTRGKSLLQ